MNCCEYKQKEFNYLEGTNTFGPEVCSAILWSQHFLVIPSDEIEHAGLVPSFLKQRCLHFRYFYKRLFQFSFHVFISRVFILGVKGVSATGVVPRNWRANGSAPLARRTMRLISFMGRLWARLARIRTFRFYRLSWMFLWIFLMPMPNSSTVWSKILRGLSESVVLFVWMTSAASWIDLSLSYSLLNSAAAELPVLRKCCRRVSPLVWSNESVPRTFDKLGKRPVMIVPVASLCSMSWEATLHMLLKKSCRSERGLIAAPPRYYGVLLGQEWSFGRLGLSWGDGIVSDQEDSCRSSAWRLS